MKDIPTLEEGAFDFATDLYEWAKQGDATSQNDLGGLYCAADILSEEGIPQDYKKAFYWFTEAAERGDDMAQSNLGVMYANGEGVPRDYVMAHMFFNIAGANGNEIGADRMGMVAENMTPSQIEKAQDLAREWMKSHQ